MRALTCRVILTWVRLGPEAIPILTSPIDISYTPIPREARLYPYTTEGDLHVTFNSLSVLAHSTPINPNPLSDEKLKPPTPNPQNKRLLYPDPHLTCFDFLYWVTTGHVLEWTMAYSSAWNVVGKYARWSDHVRGLARTTLALTLGMKKRGEQAQSFIYSIANHPRCHVARSW